MTEIEIAAHVSRALAEIPFLRERVRILEEGNLQLQRELQYARGELDRLREQISIGEPGLGARAGSAPRPGA